MTNFLSHSNCKILLLRLFDEGETRLMLPPLVVQGKLLDRLAELALLGELTAFASVELEHTATSAAAIWCLMYSLVTLFVSQVDFAGDSVCVCVSVRGIKSN